MAVFEKDFANRLSLLESKNINLNKELTKLMNNSIDRFEQRYNALSNFINSPKNQFILIESIDYLLCMANYYLITVGDYTHATRLLEEASKYLNLFDCEDDNVSSLRSSISRNIDILSKADSINSKDNLFIIDSLYELSKKEMLNNKSIVENNNSSKNIANNNLEKDLSINRNFLDKFMILSKRVLDFIFQTFNKTIKVSRLNPNHLSQNNDALFLFQQQLLIAKFSLLAQQNDLFKLTINILEDIIDNNFDNKSKFVSDVMNKLSFLSNSKLNDDIFDISDSLAHIRNMRFSISDKKS